MGSSAVVVAEHDRDRLPERPSSLGEGAHVSISALDVAGHQGTSGAASAVASPVEDYIGGASSICINRPNPATLPSTAAFSPRVSTAAAAPIESASSSLAKPVAS